MLEDLTVVIPTVGRESVEGCLRSIAEGSAWPAHVIVVDQSPNAAAAATVARHVARGLPVEHVTSAQRGAAAARNRGFERVRTRFVAGTDDDCRVDHDWLERLATRLRARPDALVTGRVEADDGVRGTRGAASLVTTEAPAEYRRPLLRRDPLFSGNMGLALRTVERVGPMDEHPSVRFAEDAEWSYRALRARVPIVYAPEIRVAHATWPDAAQMADTYRRYARSQGGFYGHYLRCGDAFIALRVAFDLLRAPWLLARGLATADAEFAAMGRAGLTQLLPGIAAGLRRGGS